MKRDETATNASVSTPKLRELSGDELSSFIVQLFEDRGSKAFMTAKKAVLEEVDNLDSKTTKAALKFFASYWKDTTRPALLSIACEALGGDPEDIFSLAVPLTLICGAIDIHDDIIDESKTKGTHLTLYGRFGKDVALLIGDALFFKGLMLLFNVKGNFKTEQLDKAMQTIKNLFFEMGDSQVLESSFKGRVDLDPKKYLSMVKKKAADFEAYMRVSAIVAGGSVKETEVLAQYGRTLGILTVLGDDIMDMSEYSELRNRVKHEVLPLPLLYALQRSDLRAQLVPIIRKEKLGKRDAQRVLDIIYKSGTFDKAEKMIYKLIAEGRKTLSEIPNSDLLDAVLRSTYTT